MKHLLSAALLVLITAPAPLTADDTQSVDTMHGVPYLTLRDKTGSNDPTKFYGEDRSGLKAGWCVTRTFDLGFLSSVARDVPLGLADDILRVGEIKEMPEENVLGSLKERAAGSAPVLYTHGFYIDFDKGCRRATVFQENTGLEDQFIWFSWPSDGAILNYQRDESDLYWSVPDLADVIIGMEERFGPGKFNLAGHSLGARGIMLALYHVSSAKPDLRAGDVVLIAADIDFGVFRKILPHIRPLVNSLTIYTSDRDLPLGVSAQVHGYPRLGQSGNPVETLMGVEAVDTSRLPTQSPSGHLYHIYSKKVGRDIAGLLGQGKPANDRENLTQIGPNLWMLDPDD